MTRRGDDHGHESDRETGHESGHETGHDPGRDVDDHDHADGLIERILLRVGAHSHAGAATTDSALETSARGIRAVKVSLAVLIATALLQVMAVVVTGSVALLADTIHNFSDALTSVPLWIAFVLGRRAANRTYTYGYRRAEDIAGLFIVAMIALSAVLVGWESVRRLIDPQPVVNLGLVALAGLIGFLGNELVAAYRIRVGREIGSAALVADGLHARTDGITSLAVVVGAAGVAIGFPAADPIVGLLITAAILWILRDALRTVVGRLMDAVDPRLVDQLEHVADDLDDVLAVHQVRVRWIGHRLEASLHIVIDCTLSVAAGHEIAERLRGEVHRRVRGVDSVLIHIDPCEGEDHLAAAEARRRGAVSAGTASSA